MAHCNNSGVIEITAILALLVLKRIHAKEGPARSLRPGLWIRVTAIVSGSSALSAVVR